MTDQWRIAPEQLAPHVAVVVCPRDCPSLLTANCLGPAMNGAPRCIYCGQFMPIGDAIDCADWVARRAVAGAATDEREGW